MWYKHPYLEEKREITSIYILCPIAWWLLGWHVDGTWNTWTPKLFSAVTKKVFSINLTYPQILSVVVTHINHFVAYLYPRLTDVLHCISETDTTVYICHISFLYKSFLCVKKFKIQTWHIHLLHNLESNQMRFYKNTDIYI